MEGLKKRALGKGTYVAPVYIILENIYKGVSPPGFTGARSEVEVAGLTHSYLLFKLCLHLQIKADVSYRTLSHYVIVFIDIIPEHYHIH